MRIFLLACISFLYFSIPALSQEVLFNLTSDSEFIATSAYRYALVSDARPQKNTIGEVYDPAGQKRTVRIQGKLEQQVLNLFNKKLVSSGSPFYNVEVHVNLLELSEKLNKATNIFDGSVKLNLSYFLQGLSDPIKLVDYSGSLTYRRTKNNYNRVELVVNKVFYNAMDYFDDWINAHELNNPTLAQKVSLKIYDPIRTSKKDTVFYDPNRPLVWDDFKDSPTVPSRFNASIFTSFSIEGNAEILDGELIQTVEFKIYMLPEQSWVRTRSDYAISHEQLHFDLVRIAVDRMISKLGTMDLEREFYDAKLHTAFLDGLRELGKFQESYDGETRHGLDEKAQIKWSNWIERGLKGDYQELEKRLN